MPNGRGIGKVRVFRPAFQSVEKVNLNLKYQKTAETRIKFEPMLCFVVLCHKFSPISVIQYPIIFED
ncbi:MAG: hypothetical protein A2X13_00990 [Bacteroidetes bacterium GWC2_33_15]|nr:MAG: hypothetical protein A2X10_00085 [Bacteroidetes bacterium GWA2_33_15]OFX49938.1 MAG: hypothetical protein A2X13_00990 [Bacteroidetes bacterium GWC2_33_15]OFX64213.1 MAG: hypothetical protein A2X15_15175 [Bacteroidetes bacterium GWB2_32_14]OFX69626.1 MAG: hypothetical protein A2X14_15470 [Bacteroidetes bacterium GWD2_33_33]HAN19510.1 hypothetical protein [Bacteroidales bacterium]